MNFELVFTKHAELELDEVFVWYEDQQSGLGFKFIKAFEECLNKINRNPYYAFNIQENARSASLEKFPYDIIYIVDENKLQVRIIAVIHQHRNPEWLKRRLHE